MAQKWPKITQNGPKWPKYDPKWPQMAQEWPKMVQNGPKMTQNDPKWPKMAKNGPKMTQIGQKISTTCRFLLLCQPPARESSKKLCRTFAQYLLTGSTHLLFALEFLNFSPLVGSSRNNLAKWFLSKVLTNSLEVLTNGYIGRLAWKP